MNAPVPAKRLYRFGLFEADADSGRLQREGVRVKLQDQPFRLLCLLLERSGQIVTREEVRRLLWSQDTHVEFEGSLNSVLNRLRFALGDSAENPIFIETLPKRGYRFLAPVTVTDSAPVTHPEAPIREQELPAAKVDEPSPDVVRVAPEPPRKRRNPRWAYGPALVLLAALGVASYHRLTSARDSSPVREAKRPSITPRRSVAVIGFNNASARAEDEWISVALSEMMSTELATGEKLRLVPGEEVANLRISSPWQQTGTLGRETTARIGTALNSDVLVLGSYASIGKAAHGQLRLDVRLQDTRTGEVLGQMAKTCSTDDLFRATSEIGARLRDRLGVPGISDAEQAGVLASLPLNREAARFYALGIAKIARVRCAGGQRPVRASLQSGSEVFAGAPHAGTSLGPAGL